LWKRPVSRYVCIFVKSVNMCAVCFLSAAVLMEGDFFVGYERICVYACRATLNRCHEDLYLKGNLRRATTFN